MSRCFSPRARPKVTGGPLSQEYEAIRVFLFPRSRFRHDLAWLVLLVALLDADNALVMAVMVSACRPRRTRRRWGGPFGRLRLQDGCHHAGEGGLDRRAWIETPGRAGPGDLVWSHFRGNQESRRQSAVPSRGFGLVGVLGRAGPGRRSIGLLHRLIVVAAACPGAAGDWPAASSASFHGGWWWGSCSS